MKKILITVLNYTKFSGTSNYYYYWMCVTRFKGASALRFFRNWIKFKLLRTTEIFYLVMPLTDQLEMTLIFTHPGISSKIFHQYWWHFCKVSGASGPCDVLVTCSCQHRMHSMSHLMEQVVYHARGQEAWIWPAWCWQI